MQDKELLGRNINPGNLVIIGADKSLFFGIVTKITDKNIRVSHFRKDWLNRMKVILNKSSGLLYKNCFLIQDESKVFSKEELEVINMLRKDL